MAKLKAPLFSFSARRRLGDDVVFQRRGQLNIAGKRQTHPDARSAGQLSWRHMFQKVVSLWHALSPAEQLAWESAARIKHMTGYAWFVSQALRPNPGIYLPLQGGVMQGGIDMATFKIENLPDPLADQEPVTRLWYYDNLPAGDPGDGHITLFPWNYDSIGQGTWTLFVDASELFNGDFRNVPASDLDNFTILCFLAAGTYTMRVLYSGAGSYGIVDIDIDGVEVGSYDGYNPPLTYNNVLTVTGIVVAASGLNPIRVRVDGKDPASIGYNVRMNQIAFWRTA